MSAPFGAAPSRPHYVGGGDLWEEPDPLPRFWLVRYWLTQVRNVIAKAKAKAKENQP